MSPLALVMVGAMVFAAAEFPFVGMWKLNPAKIQFTGTALGFEQLPSGEMRTTAEGQSDTFKTDRKEYPAPFGATAAWKQLNTKTGSHLYHERHGPRSFELIEKLDGNVVYRGTYTLSEDGKTLTAVSSPEGTNEKVTAV